MSHTYRHAPARVHAARGDAEDSRNYRREHCDSGAIRQQNRDRRHADQATLHRVKSGRADADAATYRASARRDYLTWPSF